MSALTIKNESVSRKTSLTQQPFDLLVIGAGIYGATLACIAARAGLKVALIEQGDYGEGASANSLKILHGGLRYLQQMDLVRMRESIAARKHGLLNLSYLAHPASFLAPAGGGVKRSRPAFYAAAKLNDYISRTRNEGVPLSQHLGATEVLSPHLFRKMLPHAHIAHHGGLMWADGFVENTERFTLAFVMSARESGAVTVNYTRAVRLLRNSGAISGVVARDEERGEEFEIRARMTVHTAAAWLGEIWPELTMTAASTARVRAYNIVVRKKWFGKYGVGLDGPAAGSAAARRSFFFAPWREGTIIGTVYKPFDPATERCRLAPEEIHDFVRDVNQLYPAASLTIKDVTFAHVGILPAKLDRHGNILPEPSGQTVIHDSKALTGVDGLMAIQGVKYTTAEPWARHLLAMVMGRLGRNVPEPGETPLYGAETVVTADDVLDAAMSIGWYMNEDMASWLSSTYGARYREVLEITRENATWRSEISQTATPLAAVVHAVRNEDAKHLVDVLFRRTDIATFAFPGDDALSEAATVMARLLGWDDEEKNREMQAVRKNFERLGIPV